MTEGCSGVSENKNLFSFDYILESRARTKAITKVFSPWHVLGGYLWRLMIFPMGNAQTDFLSVYMQCGGPAEPHCRDRRASKNESSCENPGNSDDDDSKTSQSWECFAKLWLHVIDQSHPNVANMSTFPSSRCHGVKEDVRCSCECYYCTPYFVALRDRKIPEGKDIVQHFEHTFTPKEDDWGFLELASFTRLESGVYKDQESNLRIKATIRL